ncbi:MAG: hypothetical protein ACYC3X_16265 [Pirellulaceae bacterium]
MPLTAIVASVVIVLTALMLVIALRDDAGGSALVPHAPLPASPAANSPAATPANVPTVSSSPAASGPGGAKQSAPAAPTVPVDNPPASEPETVPANSPPLSLAPSPAPSPPEATPPEATPPNLSGPPESTDSASSSADLAQLEALLHQARSAIAVHQFAVADAALQKATAVATTAEHQALVERLRRLGQCADEFWNVVTSGARKLQATEEIKIGSGESDLVVIVVENGRDSITVRNQGRNIAYPLADLPAGLALAIARRNLNEDDPQSHVLFGAGLVTAKDMKPAYIDEARRYWERAAESGADVADLLATLTDSYKLGQ